MLGASQGFESTRKTELDKAVQEADQASGDAATEQAKAISDAEKNITDEKSLVFKNPEGRICINILATLPNIEELVDCRLLFDPVMEEIVKRVSTNH